MSSKENKSKNIIRVAGNILFFGLMLLLLFNPTARSWVLKQLLSVGLFKPEIKDEPAQVKSPGNGFFLYQDEQGNSYSSTDLKGKVVFINFWATWCAPCLAEMPSLHEMYNQLKDDEGFMFLFISEDEDINKAKAYLQRKNYNMPLLTRSGSIPAELYNGTLPTTVVLDKTSKLVMKHEGLGNYNTPKFINQLKSLQ